MHSNTVNFANVVSVNDRVLKLFSLLFRCFQYIWVRSTTLNPSVSEDLELNARSRTWSQANWERRNMNLHWESPCKVLWLARRTHGPYSNMIYLGSSFIHSSAVTVYSAQQIKNMYLKYAINVTVNKELRNARKWRNHSVSYLFFPPFQIHLRVLPMPSGEWIKFSHPHDRVSINTDGLQAAGALYLAVWLRR